MIFEKLITNIYKSLSFVRCDDNKTAYYFTYENFKGLNKKDYAFFSSKGHSLKGAFYYYDCPTSKRIIVFDHGFGAGHLSYMKEIEMLCKKGYLVFSYDHTGCMKSGGENTGGMAQSLCDLNDCLTALKSLKELSGYDFSVMGHSWGGYSSLNISAFHQDISHIVVLSGFVSVKRLMESFFKGVLKVYIPAVTKIEKSSNPDFVDFDATETLKKSKSKILLIYSKNDKMCSLKNFELLKASLGDKKNVSFILEEDKGHNPNYTKDAVLYLAQYVKKKNSLTRKKKLSTEDEKAEFLNSFDWDRMTKQDENVWEKIFEFLEK